MTSQVSSQMYGKVDLSCMQCANTFRVLIPTWYRSQHPHTKFACSEACYTVGETRLLLAGYILHQSHTREGVLCFEKDDKIFYVIKESITPNSEENHLSWGYPSGIHLLG